MPREMAQPDLAWRRVHVADVRPPGSAITSCRASRRVLQAEQAAFLVVGEFLGIAAPIDHGTERGFGILLGHEVLELRTEPRVRRCVARPLVKDAPDKGGERGGGGAGVAGALLG